MTPRRWFREVVPENYLALWLLMLIGDQATRAPFGADPGPGELLRIGAIAYGAYRVCMFHPVFRPNYARWLQTTPWTSTLPLPLGPVRLVLQDVVVISLATVGARRFPGLDPLLVPELFLLGYLSALCISFFLTGTRPFGYALAFGLGLLLRCWWMPGAVLVIAVGLLACGTHGLRLALGAFPWGGDWERLISQLGSFDSQQEKQKRRAQTLGWPFDVLRPIGDPETIALTNGDRLLLSLLAAWWTYAVLAVVRERVNDPEAGAVVATFVMAALSVAAARRFLIYRWRYAPPISFAGRVWTRRFLIPGYDQIYAAPAAVLTIVAVLSQLVFKLGFEPDAIFPVGVFLALLVLFCVGPSLLRWRLTGTHRITSGFDGVLRLGNQVEVQEI